ncbi:MAG TPA: NrfD/PsrC family molybdoenzyme membrane anchor subunit [Chloroflexota bacterium]|nr:NrfD/PsrC family molybdoenzyme membrane anchor subunit [Chloroflexota bacterium]
MSVRELPVYTTGRPFGDVAHLNGTGAAVTRPRDAYRNVPILARPTWGHLISAYFFLGGVSSGAFTLGSLALVGGRRRRRLSRAAHVTALITLLPCPPLLIADLGKPARFPHMLRIFKPSSPMNLGAWTLTAHGGFAAMTVLVDLAHARKLQSSARWGVSSRKVPSRSPASPPPWRWGGIRGYSWGPPACRRGPPVPCWEPSSWPVRFPPAWRRSRWPRP